MLLIFPFLLVLAACGDPLEKLYKTYHEQVSSVGNIDDDMVIRYARTIRLLRAEGIEFQQKLAEDPARQKEAFDRIERVIRKGGFKDFPEFVKVNAKIAWAWNMAQGQLGMERQKRLNTWAQDSTDGGIRQIDEALANPAVPEDTKADLRKTRAQLVEQKETIAKTWDRNKKWADWALKMTMPLTNDADMTVVRRNQRLLMEAFTGLSKEQLDAIQDHSMRQLGIE